MEIFGNEYDLESLKKNFAILRENFDMKIKVKAVVEVTEEDFFEAFDMILQDAVEGNVVAQDYISYIYKRGYKKFIPASYKTYMKWAMLAAANGNKFTIEKLKIFLTPAVNIVMSAPDFEDIIKKNELYLETYEHIIGRLYCEAIVDYLKIDINELVTQLTTIKVTEDDMQEMRVFEKARVHVVDEVFKVLRQ